MLYIYFFKYLNFKLWKILHTIFTDYTHFNISNILYQYNEKQNCQTVKTVRYRRKRKKSIPIIYIYMTTWFPGKENSLKVEGLKSFYGSKPLTVKYYFYARISFVIQFIIHTLVYESVFRLSEFFSHSRRGYL